jgi:hypothetical protein
MTRSNAQFHPHRLLAVNSTKKANGIPQAFDPVR